MSEPREILHIEHLSHSYGKARVLDDVCVTVREGESLCVIGPNGGGKSTLLKIILGLIEPSKGSVRVLGKSPREASPLVGYVPQSIRFDPLFPISAMDIVLMGRLDKLRLGRYPAKCRNAAKEALEQVGLEGAGNVPFPELSGGQRQRVLIARALACSPEILMLDEPTANIDLSVEAQFLDTLAKLREKMTVVLVTHDLDVISRVGESVLCVNRRVHRHSLPLSPETIAEIFSGKHRVEHDRRTRHRHGDHSACDHE